MSGLRSLIKRYAPRGSPGDGIVAPADKVASPLETMVLHGYRMTADDNPRPRLSLVIPSVAGHAAFGGVTTGLDIFLEIGLRNDADLRISLPTISNRRGPRAEVDRRARRHLGLDPAAIEVVRRQEETPQISVRRWDIFVSYNWWTTLNIRLLLDAQAGAFRLASRAEAFSSIWIAGVRAAFYPFSSTHMLARLAFEPTRRAGGCSTATRMHEFYQAQAIGWRGASSSSRSSPTACVRPWRPARPPNRGGSWSTRRPSIPRNCFPAAEAGLKLWGAAPSGVLRLGSGLRRAWRTILCRLRRAGPSARWANCRWRTTPSSCGPPRWASP